MFKDLVKKGGKVITTGSLMALVYFLYSIFDSRYVLRADYSKTEVDIGQIKTTLIFNNKTMNRIENKLDHFLEVSDD